MADWIKACAVDDIDEEDVIRFDHGEHTFAIYRTEGGIFATDGMCTHEQQHLSDGLVIDRVIECPLHQGRFDIVTGRALSPPVCIDLKTYKTKIEDDEVYIALD